MSKISQAVLLKEELDKLRPIKKEDELRILQKFRLDWNYHSNHLEGNSLTYGETKALILFGITAQGKPLKDHFEVTGHDEAIQQVIDVVKKERPLTEHFIRELHKLILKQPYETDAITPDGQPTKKTIQVGKYKATPNHVLTKTGEIFRFATPEETPAMMNDLIQWYRERLTAKDLNPILLAAQFHYKFIRIHPFDDGNGRIVRILMNFILMQFGYPPAIIKTQDKENYFAALRQADAGILEPFIEYVAENLRHSLEIMIKGAKGESVEEPDDIDKEVALLEQKLDMAGKAAKDKATIIKLFNQSIVPLVKRFQKKCSLFDKFYKKSSSYLVIRPGGKSLDPIREQHIENIILKDLIREDTSLIAIRYQHSYFNKSGFPKFSYASTLSFHLKMIKFSISESKNDKSPLIEKSYGEPLTEEEITNIVNTEIRKHKTFIDKKIEEFKNK